MLPNKQVNSAFIKEVATPLTLALLKESATYKWKDNTVYGKVNKFETSGGGLVGYDGKKLVCFDYRLLVISGKEILVGQIFKLSEGEEARSAFQNGLGGMSMDSVSAETHIIASLTGEKYGDIMGGLTTTGPLPAKRKN
jgi:hypothetical protein